MMRLTLTSTTELIQNRIRQILILFLVASVSMLQAQTLIQYDAAHPTARIHYCEFLQGIYKKTYAQYPPYPAIGAYSPTHGMDRARGLPFGSGVCNYIYIPTNQVLEPGKQYRMKLTVQVGDEYARVPYYQSHFGVALSSELYPNYFHIWDIPFKHLQVDVAKAPVSFEFVFRPLCVSKYVLIGVFKGKTSETMNCFACQYSFELHDLAIETWSEPTYEFVYLCDAFEKERMEKMESPEYTVDSVFFNSGSSETEKQYDAIIDSVCAKRKTSQDLILLRGYTDKTGDQNVALGDKRNLAVRDALASCGIDTSSIVMINFDESRASNEVIRKDRRVEIFVFEGKLFRKHYTEALKAAQSNDYATANEKIKQWIRTVPPENMVYALFDNWGEGQKADMFRHDLVRQIKGRHYYKGKELMYELDSLFWEDQFIYSIDGVLSVNHLPGYKRKSAATTDYRRHDLLVNDVDRLYPKHGFPSVKEVGEQGNNTLPYIIIHATDTAFQLRYLPLLRKACEDQLVSWENYALLYDKISVKRTGMQRYGTQWKEDDNGRLLGLIPFENEAMVEEYRKQVGLLPLGSLKYPEQN